MIYYELDVRCVLDSLPMGDSGALGGPQQWS